MGKTAWVAGASGLIGGHLVSMLSAQKDYDRVIAFVRSPSQAAWAKLPKVEQWPVDYRNLVAPEPSSVDDVFCALGSTTKKTPNRDEYYEIDVTFPISVAKLGLKHGAKYYGLVSAHGAKEKALSFYMQMKGQLEAQLGEFDYPHLAFARPSLLLGERDEFRPAEKLGEVFMGLLPGNWKAIHAHDVAAALILEAKRKNKGTVVLSSASMQDSSQQLAN
jgi:uncharacterized protein YbjT (DUF2867 family)